jgi:alanyl aminopeptidase
LREGRLLPEDVQPQAARFIRETFGPAARDLGWNPAPDEEDERRLLRPEVLRLVGQDGEDPEIIAQGRKIAEAWLADRHSAPGDVAGTALVVAAAGGDRAFFDRLMAAVKSGKERGDRARILFALMQFPKPELIREAVQLTLSDELDPRESSALLGGFGRGQRLRPVAAAVVFDFVKENFAALSQRMSRNFAAGVPSMFGALCDEKRAEEVEATFGEAARKSQGGPRRLAQALEGMRLCAAFRKAQAQSATEFLRRTASSPSGSR